MLRTSAKIATCTHDQFKGHLTKLAIKLIGDNFAYTHVQRSTSYPASRISAHRHDPLPRARFAVTSTATVLSTMLHIKPGNNLSYDFPSRACHIFDLEHAVATCNTIRSLANCGQPAPTTRAAVGDSTSRETVHAMRGHSIIPQASQNCHIIISIATDSPK